MKCKRYILLPILFVCLLAPVASAILIDGPKYDDFSAQFQGNNELTWGIGSGWNNGDWIYYDQGDWWNQWFYDDPPSRDRMKHIEYQFNIVPLSFDPLPDDVEITVEVALNWSTMEYLPTGETGQPPMPGEDEFIQRKIVFSETLYDPIDITVDGTYDIWDYNPEWVSIDVRMYAWGYYLWTDPDTGKTFIDASPLLVDISGEIIHECIVPEPTSLAPPWPRIVNSPKTQNSLTTVTSLAMLRPQYERSKK